jgi:tetratricopeptide (TPR) repeat protein
LVVEKSLIIKYMQNPSVLDDSTLQGLKEMIADFPYFAAPRMLYLRNLKNLNSYKFEYELEKHAPFVPDRLKLYKLLHETETKVDEFELLPYDEQVIESLNTNELKDSAFIDEIPTAPFIYETYQLKHDEGVIPKQKNNDLIDKFLDSTGIKPPSGTTLGVATELAEESVKAKDDLITDTLAKIYIQQGFFEKAIDAYEKLSLKFPEKNVYFAAQIEEIKKLMSKE